MQKVLPLYADHVIRFRTHFEESTKRKQNLKDKPSDYSQMAMPQLLQNFLYYF